MKVQAIASPTAIQQSTSNNTEAKARAMAAFMGSKPAAASQQAAQPIVQNQNAVAPEEMGAVKAPEATTRQDDKIEVVQEDTKTTTSEDTTAAKADASDTDTTTQDPALSKQFAQLARQEKMLRAQKQQQEQSLKAREDALKAKEDALAAKDQTYKSGYYSKDQLKQDTLTVLAEAGVSYDELTQQIINQQPVDPRLQNTINSLKSQIEELKAANEESRKSYTDNQTQAYQAAVKQITTDANNLIKSDPEAYEAISKTGTVKEVVKLIEETYKKDGILLSVEEAAQEVENYLVEENFKMATKIDKIKRKIQASAPNVSDKSAQSLAEKAAGVTTPQQTQQMKTLTNATSSTRQLSARERALLAFEGKLKS